MEFKNLDDVKEFIIKTTNKYRLSIPVPYKIEFSTRMTSTLGRCRHYYIMGNATRITFTYNVKYLLKYLNRPEQIENTVTHEIAHAIVGGLHHHDSVWKAQHIKMGGNGKRLFVKEA